MFHKGVKILSENCTLCSRNISYLFIRLSFYNTSISISRPENRRLTTMYCIAKITNVLFHFPESVSFYNTSKSGRLLCINGNNTESLPEYTAELLCKEISTLGYCYISRKTFALQATRAINVG